MGNWPFWRKPLGVAPVSDTPDIVRQMELSEAWRKEQEYLATIATLQSENAAKDERIKRLEGALRLAAEKLETYRAHSNGEYKGGMEHMALMRAINEVLKK